MIDLLNLLAQATTAPASGPPPSGTEVFLKNIFPLLLVIGLFWWIMSRGRRKEQRRYQDMLNTLKRNDKVQTIGGIIGTIVDVREAEGEVVLKIDEGSNTKVRFTRQAIKGVVQDLPAETR